MKSWLVIFLFFFVVVSGYAQCNFQFRGQVVSAEDGTSLPLATVEIVSENKAEVSDGEGRFLIDNICHALVNIRVRYVGFAFYESAIDLNIIEQPFRIELSVESQELAEVTIEAKKAEVIATLKKSAIDEVQLSKLPAKSLGEVLSNFTGVNMLQTGPTITKPIIHGMHSNRILILNNGIRQEGQQWGQEHAPEIDPFMANNLELIKGAAAVKYGSDAIGGVILVNPDDLPKGGSAKGRVSAIGATNNGLYSGSGIVEGGLAGIDGFGWRIQSTYKRAGDSRAADYRLTNTGMKELNYSLGLGYHKENSGIEFFYSAFNAEYGILRASHFGNLTDLERAVGAPRPLIIGPFSYDINNPYQKVNHQLAKVNGHLDVDGIGELTAQYGFQHNNRKEFDIRRGGRSTIPSLSLDLYTHIVELDLDIESDAPWQGDFGASFMYQNNRNNPETGIRPLIPDFQNWTAGMHGIMRYVQSNYELEAGLRYDYKHYLIKRFDENNVLQKPEFDFNNVTGSLGVLLFLKNNWTLRANLGTAWRAPHVNELYSEGLHHGAATIEEGNDSLRSERAVKWIATLTKQVGRSKFEISPYYNFIRDYIYLRPEDVTLTIRGAFPVFRYQQTDASFIGIDADYSYQLTDQLLFTSKLSLIRAMDEKTSAPLLNIPPGQLDLGFEKRFRSSRVLEPFIGLDVMMVAKQGNAPRVVTVSEIIDAELEGKDLFENDKSMFDILPPPPGYVNFKLNGGFSLPVHGQNKMDFFLTIDNVLNNSYRNYLNRFRYFADDLGTNISLRINYSF